MFSSATSSLRFFTLLVCAALASPASALPDRKSAREELSSSGPSGASQDADGNPLVSKTEQVQTTTATITAKKSEFVQATSEYVASGDVHFQYKDVDLYCDEFRANFDLKTVEAKGNVRLQQGDRLFKGERFRYNFGKQEGVIDKAHVQIEGFNFTGDEIVVNGPAIRIKHATASACQSDSQHFKIVSDQIDIQLGKEATFRRSYIVVGGHRLFRVPKYTVNLKRSEGLYHGQGFSPVLFVNGRDGLFAGGKYRYQLNPGSNHFYASADFGSSALRGTRGGSEIGYRHQDFAISLRGQYRGTADYHFNPSLLVDIRPELVVQSRPFVLVRNRLGIYALAEYGAFRELPSNVTSNRRNLELHLDTRSVMSRPRFYAHGFFRRSDYFNQNSALTVYGAELGTHGRLSRSLSGDFAIILQNVNGRTPLQFDEVLIARELRADFDYFINRNWIVPVLLRYDMSNNVIPDKRFGLMRAYDCVAYGLSFDTARREFRFEGRFLLSGKYR